MCVEYVCPGLATRHRGDNRTSTPSKNSANQKTAEYFVEDTIVSCLRPRSLLRHWDQWDDASLIGTLQSLIEWIGFSSHRLTAAEVEMRNRKGGAFSVQGSVV